MRAVGDFRTEPGFEFDYGMRWMEHGYKTAFLPDGYAVHLGKPSPNEMPEHALEDMYHRHGLRHTFQAATSAYDLNGSTR